MSGVVDSDGLTSAWLSAALDRDVTLLSCVRIGTGQTAAAYRLRLDAAGLPPTVVAKVAVGAKSARERVRGGLVAEVGFYQHLLDTVDVRTPECWYAAGSDGGTEFTLLLSDLAPRVPGVQADGCSTASARYALDNLAGLHAPRWNDPTLLELDFLRRPDAAAAAFLGRTTLAAADIFLKQYDSELSDADVATLRTVAAAVEPWLQRLPENFALLHGDYRLDNLMFGPDDDDVVVVDWQTATVGSPARDVAYFLGTCLHVGERRGAEERLVADYHAQLVRRGVTGYSREQCFVDYRLGQLQGPMITMIGAAFALGDRTVDSDAMFLAMARRSCTAIRDLGSVDLL